MLEIRSRSEADTLAAGRRLAGLLMPGDVVLLEGRLGSGKTLFAGGVADGLGVDEAITSPSFVLLRHYRGFLPLVHADVYRLGSMAELEDLELGDAAEEAVLLVEWGSAVRSGLPEDHLIVHFDVTGDTERIIRLVPKGSWLGRSLEEAM
jgi:tRNA threonylcarbamoyladenosine biosynthesis protein TsaE